MSVACGRIHPGHEWFSDDPQGRQMIFQCLAAHSQYSLPVDALNVIVESSYSLPVKVNNSTIELHLPVDSQYSLPSRR